MTKDLFTWVGTTAARGGIIATLIMVGTLHASGITDEAQAPAPAVDSDALLVLAHGLPEPVREVRLTEYLYRQADLLADACADRNENQWGRELRLRTLASEVQSAVALVADADGNILGYADWKWASNMLWIAHRETRLARNPAKLGNQDDGRAHGMWQVWQWHKMDPFAAITALDMLVHEPSSSWSLPKGNPWLGYPEAGKWVQEHPFQ